MPPAFPESRPDWRTDWRRPSISQRGLAIGLTLLAELVFLAILLGLAPTSFGDRKPASRPTVVDLVPAPEPEPPAAAAQAQTAEVAKPVPRLPTPRVPPVPNRKSPFLELTREEYAAADISKLGSAGGKGKSGAGETTASVGTGPGGVTLYAAEWYRRPTNAELGGYLPKRDLEPGSWAEVACKTIPDNRVENCQAIGENPPGSGLGKALRLAGWQLRIRPPMINGKPMIGTWVLVHIDYRSVAE